MEINIKLNVADIGIIINEVACAVATDRDFKSGKLDKKIVDKIENATKEHTSFDASVVNVIDFIDKVMGVNKND